MTFAGCVTEDLLIDLLAGEITGNLRDAIDSHLDHCAECRQLVAAMFRSTTSTSEPAFAVTLPVELQPGQTVERFVSWHCGYDVELGRDVRILALDDPTQEAAFAVELAQAARIEHSGIAVMLRSGRLRDGRAAALFSFAPGGKLHDATGHGDEPAAAVQLQLLDLHIQVSNALAYAHSQASFHGSLGTDTIRISADHHHALLYGIGSAWRRCQRPASAHDDVRAIGMLIRRGLSRRLLRGPLASILDAADATPPRYASAVELSADLNAFRSGAPVTMHRYDRAGAAWQWASTHRAVVAILVAGIVATTIVVGSAWHTLGQQTRRAAHAAQVRRAIVQQVQQTVTRELAAQPEVRDQLLQKLRSYE
ncbi:MAG: zf-HC2 domain-containing protein [Kofleriaceae bacterium]|nr:zf-HC2 domain-containing protein [Kofleriaceae bacterium]